jgi:hypothetical protein
MMDYEIVIEKAKRAIRSRQGLHSPGHFYNTE